MINRHHLSVLLAGTALTCTAMGASAQTAPTSGTAPSATAAAAAAAVESTSESVTVTGRSARDRSPGGGLLKVETAPKAVQTISRDFIAKQAPTDNGEQLLRLLPSANVSEQDPYGLAGGNVKIRGLDSSEIGWLLDGAPLNDVGGSAFYPNEVLEAEDLDSITLTPGSTTIDAPTTSASAGLVQFSMKDPALKPGGLLDVTYGTYKLNREFIRLDSGVIGNSGIRFFFGFSHTHANNFRGPGGNEKKHIDFKLVKDFNNGSRTSLTVSYNSQDSIFYSFPTQATYFNSVEKGASGGSYLSTYPGPSAAATNFYRLHDNPFENLVTSAPSTIVLAPRLHIDDTPYFWHGIGNGTGASFLTEGQTFYGSQNEPIDLNFNGRISSKDSVLALTPSNQEQFRPGNVAKLIWDVDRHNQAEFGYWYEYSNLLQYSPVGIVNQQTGVAANIWGVQDLYDLPNGKPYWYRNFLTLTQVNMLFVGDHAKYFDDRLTIDAGFKEAMVRRNVYNEIPGTTYNRNINVAEPLPQLGVSWQFDKRNQIYVGAATNFRAPSNTSLVDQRSNTSGAITQLGGPSNSEYSISEDLGYRYNGSVFVGSIDFFNYNFTNRQLSLNTYVNGANYSQTVNAGGQTSRGVDIQLATLPILYHLRPYVTFEYLDATIDNNLRTTGTLDGRTVVDYLPTAGKTAYGSPKTSAGLGLDYDDGRFFAGVDLKYEGAQYSTFTNDEKQPYFVTNTESFGYRFHSLGALKAPQIQVNTTNLTGATYRTGIYSFTNNAKATRGVFGSTIAGSSPSYYLQPGFSISATLSSAF